MTTAAIPNIFDTQSLVSIKSGLRKDDPQALKAAARQFEAQMRLLQTAESNDRSAGQLLGLQG